MNKTNVGLSKPGKEEDDCICKIDELIQSADILAVAREHGLAIHNESRAVCFGNHDTEPTLEIDAQTHSYRCLRPYCNSRGDVVSLIQEITDTPFVEALGMLSNGNDTVQWLIENKAVLETIGEVRDCMDFAARHYANAVDLVAPYLNSRGVSVETAREFMIGGVMDRGKESLKLALLEAGFDIEIIRKTGLLNKYDRDYFQRHVVVPIFHNGQVVDFYGRLLSDDPAKTKHWRLSGNRIVLGHSLFNWNPHAEEIILVEGVFDALALIEKGFTNAVSAWGTNGLPIDLLDASAVKKVFMCFDGDSAGRTQNIKRAYDIKDTGREVRIIDMPDGLDPNEYFLTDPAANFGDLIRKAQHPEKWEIQNIDPALDAVEAIAALEPLMLRIRDMEPMYKTALINDIAKKLRIGKKDVRDHIDNLRPNKIDGQGQPDLIDTDNLELIHPALHFGSQGAMMTIPFMGKNPKNNRSESLPFVVTAQRELFALTHEELNSRGYYCNDIICPGRKRYTSGAIREFLGGRAQGDIGATFNLIKRTYQGYLDFSDPRTHDYLTAWTIGTYFFPVFNYYPYLHFTGTKEVGKSKAMKLMSQLCFNGIMSVSLTDASQFRIITEFLPTLFLDETENLNDKSFSERRALLLGGYEKGSTAIRTEKVEHTFRAREYDNYSPRVFGSIEGLEDTLASRTIQIPMRRSYNDKIKEAEVELENGMFQIIRDKLFHVTMEYGQKIKEIYETAERPEAAIFDAREWNLFKPIMSVGISTGNDEIVEALIEFANASYNAKTESLNDTSVENVILRCLKEIVQEENWYALDVIHPIILDFIRVNGLNVGQLSKNRLGSILRNLHVTEQKERRKVAGDKKVFHFIRPSTVKKVADNYRVR